MAKKYDIENKAVAADPSETFDEFDDLENEIETAGGEIERDLKARVYRVTQNDRGRDLQEYCGFFSSIVDEEQIARSYGPGKYRVYYNWKSKSGERKQTTRAVNIGGNFSTPAPAVESSNQKPASPFSLGDLLGGLTVEKITAAAMALKTIKELIAPPPPPPFDFVKLLEVMTSAQKPAAPTVSDSIVLKAMEMQQQQQKAAAPSLIEQIKQIKEAKETLSDVLGNESEGGDKMDYFIKMGLQMLPALLQQHGGNYQQAAASVRENPMIAGLIANDPELAQKFITAAAERYGDAAAAQLAAGFGYSMEREETPAQITAPETLATPETPAASNAEKGV